jgi:hypothetical protein
MIIIQNKKLAGESSMIEIKNKYVRGDVWVGEGEGSYRNEGTFPVHFFFAGQWQTKRGK